MAYSGPSFIRAVVVVAQSMRWSPPLSINPTALWRRGALPLCWARVPRWSS